VGAELAVLTPQGPLGNVKQFAQLAQQAREGINKVRGDFAGTDESGNLGQAEVQVSSGASDLANAMAALAAYTDSPSSATLAQFTSQYQNARSEWNSGVQTIWRIAGHGNPPAI
jgi:hypothetical protein